jgi:putative heme-binding domain-containing protein
MRRNLLSTCGWAVLSLIGCVANAAEPARVEWTQSRLVGSPEPPPPFVLERAFPHQFMGPISINRIPKTAQYLVLEQGGKIFHFDATSTEDPKLVVDFNQSLPPFSQIEGIGKRNINLFSLAFHPNFESNRAIYVCYITNGNGAPTDTHVAKFSLPAGERLTLPADSEDSVLVCEGGGHNGCTLAFGPDGYLYISLGDLEVPTPPDPRNTGQDISDLYASILRIDVDRKTSSDDSKVSVNYAIPSDNPFVQHPGARPEVYAYGLRNPFRMAFDSATGDLWVGDVGWEAWEMVYRVKSGGNYGWAIKEGPGNVKPQTPGPTPITAPDIALGHAEAASITGGMVVHGTKHPKLNGKYVFGDWVTRKFWASSFDANRVIDTQEIASTNVKPICFETDPHGELLVLEYSEGNQAAGIYHFVPNPASAEATRDFPRKLSETGLFSDVAKLVAAPGVVPYEINAAMWADGAQAEYLVAIPGHGKAEFFQNPQKTFNWYNTKVKLPIGSVLAKTFRFGEKPIETQLSVKDFQGEWQYYSYRWNAEVSDAHLVDAAGETVELLGEFASGVEVGHGGAPSTWTFAARSSCRICHTIWTGETVGFTEPQLRAGHAGDSWNRLLDLGVIKTDGKQLQDSAYSALVNPHQVDAPLDRRARSYLHANCGHCHMNGGNASTVFGLNFELSLDDAKMIGVPPMRGTLGLDGAMLVMAGKPADSVLLYRMAKAGSGHMPHVGAHRIDPAGVKLIRQWIAQLSTDADRRRWLDIVGASRYGGQRDAARLEAANQLLASPAGAIELACAFADGAIMPQLRSKIVDAAMLQPAPVSELFEAYASKEQLPKRLGESFAPNSVLELVGDAERGAKLFASGAGTCVNCHRVGEVGKELGPDFAASATKYKTPEKLLEQIVEPSLVIDEKYRSVSILTTSDTVIVGRVIAEDAERVIYLGSDGKESTILLEDIEAMRPSPVSMMPEHLLAPLTAQQSADLLAYVLSLAI